MRQFTLGQMQQTRAQAGIGMVLATSWGSWVPSEEHRHTDVITHWITHTQITHRVTRQVHQLLSKLLPPSCCRSTSKQGRPCQSVAQHALKPSPQAAHDMPRHAIHSPGISKALLTCPLTRPINSFRGHACVGCM